MKLIAPVKIRFRAFGVPALRATLRSGIRREVETPNWRRLQKHIDAHRAAGGRVKVTASRFEYPQRIDGWAIVETRNVILDWEGERQ